MKRASFLKRLAGLVVAPVVAKDLDLESDWLLEEFKEAGLEPGSRSTFWLDRMLEDAWREGRSPELVLLSREAYREVLQTAAIAADMKAPSVNLYVSDFGTVRLFHAEEFPWVELNEHGAWLLDEYPSVHALDRTAAHLSGGPLNGRTVTFPPGTHAARILEFPYWDSGRGVTVRVRYEHAAGHTWRYTP